MQLWKSLSHENMLRNVALRIDSSSIVLSIKNSFVSLSLNLLSTNDTKEITKYQ